MGSPGHGEGAHGRCCGAGGGGAAVSYRCCHGVRAITISDTGTTPTGGPLRSWPRSERQERMASLRACPSRAHVTARAPARSRAARYPPPCPPVDSGRRSPSPDVRPTSVRPTELAHGNTEVTKVGTPWMRVGASFAASRSRLAASGLSPPGGTGREDGASRMGFGGTSRARPRARASAPQRA